MGCPAGLPGLPSPSPHLARNSFEAARPEHQFCKERLKRGAGTGCPGGTVGRISSASPQLGAAKRGQEAGIAPGRSPPAQPPGLPRLPPGPKGLPEGAKPEPANGTPETQTQRNRQELKIRHGRPSVSLVFQLLCRLQESSPVHELLQACP